MDFLNDEKLSNEEKLRRYFLESGKLPYSDREAAAKAAEEQKSGMGIGSALSGIGAAIAGKDVNQSMDYFDKRKQAIDEATIGAYDKASKEQSDRVAEYLKNKYAMDLRNQEREDMKNERAQARQEARADRALSRDLALREREDKLSDKRDEKELALAVPGFQRTGEVLPKVEEAMKLRKATATSDQLKTKLNRLKELVQKEGSFEYGGEAGQEMESLATEIQLLGKSPELYELGVLAGPDLTLLQKITADPTSMSSLFTRDKTRLKQIDSQLKSIDDKLSATSKSLGYVPKEQKKQEVQSKPKTIKQNGHTYILNEATGQYE